MKSDGPGNADAARDRDTLRLYFDLKNADMIPSFLQVIQPNVQRNRGQHDRLWDRSFAIPLEWTILVLEIAALVLGLVVITLGVMALVMRLSGELGPRPGDFRSARLRGSPDGRGPAFAGFAAGTGGAPSLGRASGFVATGLRATVGASGNQLYFPGCCFSLVAGMDMPQAFEIGIKAVFSFQFSVFSFQNGLNN